MLCVFVRVRACAVGCACVCTFNILYIKKKILLQFHSRVINRIGDGSQAGKWNVTIGGRIVYVSFHSETVLPIARQPLHPTVDAEGLFLNPVEAPLHASAGGVLDERGASRRWRQVKRGLDGEAAARVSEVWRKWFSIEQFIHRLGFKWYILKSVLLESTMRFHHICKYFQTLLWCPPESERWWGGVQPI